MKRMRTQLSYIVIVLPICLLHLCTKTYCQQPPASNAISIRLSSSGLYANLANPITVMSGRDTIRSLVVKASQGRLRSTGSNNQLVLDSLQNGSTVYVSVFNKTSAGLVLVKTENFIVTALPAEQTAAFEQWGFPIMTWEGYLGGDIPLATVQHATHFSINKPYVVSRMTIDFLGTGFPAGRVCQQFLGDFLPEVKEALTHVGPGTQIVLDNIVVTAPNGKDISLPPIALKVY